MDYDDEHMTPQVSSNDKPMSKVQVYKNLVVIGAMNLLQYSATIGTSALITSTAGKTLGNIVYFLNYFFSTVLCLLSIPMLNSHIKEKEILWINNISLVIFTMANLHISYYTLIPGSFFHGSSTAMAFVTSLVYVTKLAKYYAEAFKLNSSSMISLFNGILIAFSFGGYLLGSGTTSVILTLLNSESNDESDDLYANDTNSYGANGTVSNYTDHAFNFDEDCQSSDDAIEFTALTESILRGAIIVYSILALLTTGFIDDFDKYDRIKLVLTFREKITEVIKLLWPSIKSTVEVAVKKKMYLTFPLFVAIAVNNGFIFASYSKIYITQCIGIHFVGYIIMTYGVSSALGSFILGKLLGLINYNIAVTGNVTLNSGIIFFLFIWKKQSQHMVLFLIPLIWGFCNGAWIAISCSFIGTNFGKDTQIPFALYRMVHVGSIGIASLLNFMPLKIYQISLCICFIVFACLHLIVKRFSKEEV